MSETPVPAATGITRRSLIAGGALAGPAAVMWGPAALATPGEKRTARQKAMDAKIAAAAAADLPAFPGAEGCGMYTTGGRGGEVYEVTNLNDSGPGSLREAVSGSNRTVVFRVSGNIYLEGGLDITGSNLTIAGQTAPGDGICIIGNETSIEADNVIIRYLRFRGGDMRGTEIDTFKGEGHENIVIDHCSASWGVDECFSLYGNRNVTVQYCIIAEGLAMSVHAKGRHGYGGLWGGTNVTYHHNLLIHQGGRNPRYSFVEDVPLKVDERNNVIYNYGFTSGYGGEWSEGINVVANYYRPGPDTLAEIAPVIFSPGRFGEWYIADNVVEGHPDVTEDNGKGIEYAPGGITRLTQPVSFPGELETESAEDAYRGLLDHVGASLPRRDAVDARLVNDVRNRTGRMINSQKEVGGFPPLASTTPPADSDHDGIPDEWETANGLDPNNPDDRNGTGPDGFTNLERYLNSITRTGAPNPTVTITSPAYNQVFSASTATQTVAITADATAADGASIAKVEFYAGDKLLGTATSAPYKISWTGVADGTYYLTARATDDTGTATTSTCLPVHVNQTTTVSGWRSRDVGDVPIPGSLGLKGTAFVIKGSGKIQGREDAFHFVHRPIHAGPDDVVEIIARLDSSSHVYEGLLAGVMIRESLKADSPFMFGGLTWEGGRKARVVRIASDGPQASVGDYPWDDEPLDDRPWWLRLIKRGTEFEVHLSNDSLQWTRIGYERIVMAPDVLIGMAVDGGKEANDIVNYNVATFTNVRVLT